MLEAAPPCVSRGNSPVGLCGPVPVAAGTQAQAARGQPNGPGVNGARSWPELAQLALSPTHLPPHPKMPPPPRVPSHHPLLCPALAGLGWCEPIPPGQGLASGGARAAACWRLARPSLGWHPYSLKRVLWGTSQGQGLLLTWPGQWTFPADEQEGPRELPRDRSLGVGVESLAGAAVLCWHHSLTVATARRVHLSCSKQAHGLWSTRQSIVAASAKRSPRHTSTASLAGLRRFLPSERQTLRRDSGPLLMGKGCWACEKGLGRLLQACISTLE